MKTLEQWVDNYASETLHAWGLKGYPNLLDELKEALMFAVKEAPRMPEQPKPRCDAQGRLLSAVLGNRYYMIDEQAMVYLWIWGDYDADKSRLAVGNCFISKPAAEAELTRLKCLQRLRGMEPDYGRYASVIYGRDGVGITLPFKDLGDVTSEERAAFLYREPMGEK